MNSGSKIYVAGHRGLVGSAIVRGLKARGYENLVLRTHAELDLRDQATTRAFFEKERPEFVFGAAAKVGGIRANSAMPADFLHDNLAIQTNLIHESWRSDVQKLLFLGSSCIYPKFAPQPLKEEYLLTGPLEPTNEAYSIAKIAGIKMCEAYRSQHHFHAISAMPTNLYGPADNFDLENSHVLPALIRRIHDAKLDNAQHVTIWGTGTPLREFLHADDLAAALIVMMERYDGAQFLNVGSGEEVTIRALAELIASVVGYKGELRYDPTKPDGTPRKLLDSGRVRALGWKPTISLREGIAETYAWYVQRERST